MELNDVVRKIKKLLAVAEDPSASDQEIQLAAYRAEKLMFKYKLDRKDIIEKDNSSKNVEKYYFEKEYDRIFTGFGFFSLDFNVNSRILSNSGFL